jgi:hypothetical protein
MQVCSTPDVLQSPVAQRLRQFIRRQRRACQDRRQGTPDFEQFEAELHDHMMALERAILEEQLESYDVAAPQIEVAGVCYHRVLRAHETYLSAAGPVRVARHLYRPSGRNAPSVCPLELRAGMIDGYWTPRAARCGAFAMAHLTPGEAEALFDEVGGMQPSRSSLDRLGRTLSAPWEAQREEWEAALREQERKEEPVPASATVVAFSVDGVMAPLKVQGPVRQAKRQEAGKHGSGPAGYREVGCGTVSFYDVAGERLRTLYYGRMPESKKVTLQGQLQAEAQALCSVRPGLKRVHLADGAESNWQLLAAVERTGKSAAVGSSVGPAVQIVDFYHACEHLKRGCDAIWGESTVRCQVEFERLRTLLKEDEQGVARVIGSLCYHAGHTQGQRQVRIRAELTYFRNQRARMQYAAYQRDKLPIASGVMEAACKTLVTQRLKRSGMAWSMAGGQAILTLRSLIQSGRWPQAWPLLAGHFKQPVTELKSKEYGTLQLVA